MSINLLFDMKESYLYVQMAGDLSPEEGHQAFFEVLEKASHYKATRMLIDVLEMSGDLGVKDYYEYGKFIAEAINSAKWAGKIGYEFRIAFVGKQPIVDRDHLGEIVVNNRGGRVWSFTNISDAVGWLGI